MPSRVERYKKDHNVQRRTQKNQDLYQDLRNYASYKEVSTIEPVIETDTFDLGTITKERRRTSSSKGVVQTEKISSLFMMDEDRVYDINQVLTEAKISRGEPDALEEKRKLKKEEYNITNEIDVNHLEEIQEKRKKSGIKEEEQEELKELIDTIYSQKLQEEIQESLQEEGQQEEADLLVDLLPTSESETLISEGLSKEIIEKERERKKSEKIENSFFTKSMDLSTEDLEDDDDDPFREVEKHLPIWAIILVIVGILVIVVVAGYGIYSSVR